MARCGVEGGRITLRAPGIRRASPSSWAPRTPSHVARRRPFARACRPRCAAGHRRGASGRRAAGVQPRRTARHRGARSRAIACARRCRTRSSSSRRARSPSTSRPRTCRRSPAASTCRSRSASSPPPGRSRSDALAALRVRRRAGARRGAAPDPRRAADGALRASRRSRVRAARGEAPPRRRSCASASCYPAATLLDVCAHLAGRDRSRRLRAWHPRGTPAEVRRSRRRARAGAREARAHDRRRWRPQPVDDRPARHRQVDARAAAARHPAAADRGRGARRPRRSRRSPAASRRRRGARGPSARRITRRARSRWSAAAATRGPARSRSRTTACSSSTSCRNGIAGVLEVLREPLESGRDPHLARRAPEHVSRARSSSSPR